MGISIGLTRLFYVLGEQGMLNPDLPTAPADVLILPMTDDLSAAIGFATALRENGIRQSPRGESATLPTLGPSGRQDLLNCWAKNLQ